MNHINLLPWRDELRKKRRQNFIVSLVAALVAAAVVMYGWRLLVGSQIDFQQRRNAFIKAEIQKVDKKLKEIAELDKTRASIIARMQVIQDLQARRPEAVHLMDELVTSMPDGVYLTALNQSGRVVDLQGRAQSNARVSALMRNTEDSEWLATPQLQIVENKSKDKAAGFSDFKLVVKQKRRGGDQEDEAGGSQP
jgi:type IV pilus assembly protein PilN